MSSDMERGMFSFPFFCNEEFSMEAGPITSKSYFKSISLEQGMGWSVGRSVCRREMIQGPLIFGMAARYAEWADPL